MIIFKGTRSVRDDHFLIFENEKGSSIEIPIAEEIMIWFMRYFDRLSPPTKPVEDPQPAASK
ncbi:hypothetical protein M0R72_02650 [Candidatus Pacearchaeota archaeon]|jgi:hypothetical protein|nr:hypothetical protein [Candidatus Pacearchaeota archaeon]